MAGLQEAAPAGAPPHDSASLVPPATILARFLTAPVGFEFRMRQVTQGRVQAHAVGDLLNQFRHMLLQSFHRVIEARVGLLLLQRFQKTLAAPVLPRPSRQANHLDRPRSDDPSRFLGALLWERLLSQRAV